MRYQGDYALDKKHGTWTYWTNSGGKELEETYAEGVLDGMRTSWFANGKVRDQGNYENGQQAGAWTVFYDNGIPKMTCTFLNGRMDGKVTNWHEIGTLASEKYYKEGVPEGKFKFFGKKEGELLQTIEFKNGLRVKVD